MHDGVSADGMEEAAVVAGLEADVLLILLLILLLLLLLLLLFGSMIAVRLLLGAGGLSVAIVIT